jgi:hypothetical protein
MRRDGPTSTCLYVHYSSCTGCLCARSFLISLYLGSRQPLLHLRIPVGVYLELRRLPLRPQTLQSTCYRYPELPRPSPASSPLQLHLSSCRPPLRPRSQGHPTESQQACAPCAPARSEGFQFLFFSSPSPCGELRHMVLLHCSVSYFKTSRGETLSTYLTLPWN